MENKNNTLIVLLCVLCSVVLLAGVVTGALVLTFSVTDNAVLTAESTALKHKCEYELELFNDPSDFVRHIEEVTGYDLTPDDNVEGELVIDLSAVDKDIYNIDLTDEELDPDVIYKYYCHIKYDKLPEEYIQYIEKQIANDKNFIQSLGDLKIITDSPGGDNISEYKMVYISDTEEYNTMPDVAGEYHVITVYYDMDSHSFSIGEFINKYWALEKNAE